MFFFHIDNDERMKCLHCPVVDATHCQGELASRLCDLTDAAHPDYRPSYAEVLRDHASRAPQYPPLATQAANLARALWDWAVSGFSMASEEEQARRRAICFGCEHWDGGPRRCSLCGCRTDQQIAMKSKHCPDTPARW
jgi:hypothetical protein